MKKWIAELLFIPGFISMEYGLYLHDIKAALIVGGLLLMIAGIMVAKNGVD